MRRGSLYDIDFAAAQANETIGALAGGGFTYRAYESPKEALTGADFVIISIMPARLTKWNPTYDTPEKYGIYQSVGDTVGPGGLVRALRTIPMYETIAGYIRDYCPQAGHQLHQPNECLCKNALRSVPANQGVWVLPRGIQHAELFANRCPSCVESKAQSGATFLSTSLASITSLGLRTGIPM